MTDYTYLENETKKQNMDTETDKPFKENRSEILWNVINSILAGGLVMLGALTAGDINKTAISIALITGAAVAISKFKEYWATQLPEYQSKATKAFNFF
jgi:hypothetical protein